MTWQPDYTTVADLAAYLRISDDVDDDQLALAITAASRAVDTWCHRQFGNVTPAEDRYYPIRYDFGRRLRVADIDDLQNISGLSFMIDGVTPLTDYTLESRNALVKGRPYTRVSYCGSGCELTASGLWGWTGVPDTIVQATLLQAARVFMRRTAPFGVLGSPDLTSEIRLSARLDVDVQVMLAAYRRTAGVG